MRKILLPLFSVFLFYACSTSNDDAGLPQTTQEDLKEAIIGKWDVENPNLVNSVLEKQGEIPCRIFTLIFKSDGTHQDGVTTGEYTVVSASSISLGNAGSIGYISFVGTSLVYFIELNGVCSIAAQSIRDMDYAVGDCFSFLNCYMETFWQSTEEESTAILFWTKS